MTNDRDSSPMTNSYHLKPDDELVDDGECSDLTYSESEVDPTWNSEISNSCESASSQAAQGIGFEFTSKPAI